MLYSAIRLHTFCLHGLSISSYTWSTLNFSRFLIFLSNHDFIPLIINTRNNEVNESRVQSDTRYLIHSWKHSDKWIKAMTRDLWLGCTSPGASSHHLTLTGLRQMSIRLRATKGNHTSLYYTGWPTGHNLFVTPYFQHNNACASF